MRRIVLAPVVVLALVALAAPAAWAGSPHFVRSTITATPNSDDTLRVSGREAGLGDETQVNIQVDATVGCVNAGSNHPHAANKQSVSGDSTVPVQNGHADFSITVGPPGPFKPPCDPPMTVAYLNATICDLTNGVCITIRGPF